MPQVNRSNRPRIRVSPHYFAPRITFEGVPLSARGKARVRRAYYALNNAINDGDRDARAHQADIYDVIGRMAVAPRIIEAALQGIEDQAGVTIAQIQDEFGEDDDIADLMTTIDRMNRTLRKAETLNWNDHGVVYGYRHELNAGMYALRDEFPDVHSILHQQRQLQNIANEHQATMRGWMMGNNRN